MFTLKRGISLDYTLRPNLKIDDFILIILFIHFFFSFMDSIKLNSEFLQFFFFKLSLSSFKQLFIFKNTIITKKVAKCLTSIHDFYHSLRAFSIADPLLDKSSKPKKDEC